MFHRRPRRFLIVVHPYSLAQRDTDLLAESAHLSCARICINVSCFSPDLHKDKRATLNKKQKTETSNGEPFVTKTNQASWNLLTNTISHGQTIMYIMISAIEASKKAVGCSFQMFDAGKNGLQLIDGFLTKLKNELRFADWAPRLSQRRIGQSCGHPGVGKEEERDKSPKSTWCLFWMIQTSFVHTSHFRMTTRKDLSRCVHSKSTRYRMRTGTTK